MIMMLISLILFGFSEYSQVVFCNNSTWSSKSDMTAYFAAMARVLLLMASYYCAVKGAVE